MPGEPTIDTANEARRGLDLPLTAIIAGYLLYGCAFIYRTSFIQAGVRYFVLMDDEMISMRYAKNLAHGWGMVYNPGGDRVEGFTNLMWMLYMAMLLPQASNQAVSEANRPAPGLPSHRKSPPAGRSARQ